MFSGVRGTGCQLGLAAFVLKLNEIGMSDKEHELERPIPRLWHEACVTRLDVACLSGQCMRRAAHSSATLVNGAGCRSLRGQHEANVKDYEWSDRSAHVQIARQGQRNGTGGSQNPPL